MSSRLALLALLAACPLFAGDLTERFDLTLDRVLHSGPPRYDEAFLLADVIPQDVRRFTNFSGDLSGRYVGALATAARHRSETAPSLHALVLKILRYQKADGHFGNPMTLSEVRNDDMARLWGNGRLLIGLLEYYQAHPKPEILQAARRIGDFLVSVAPSLNAQAVRRHFTARRFSVGYICWTQNIEGLVELYRHTSDDRYLNLAREMAVRTARFPAQHSHGLLTSLRGILDLSRVTGENDYLEQVETEWQEIVDSENLLVQGAIPEAFAPAIERDEGCGEADWLRLNLSLWKQTLDPKYLEHAERTLFNAFFMNQFSSGDFGHFRLSETGLGHGASRAWWCCTLHGLRTFPAVFNTVFRAQDSTLSYDLPVDGRGEIGGLVVQSASSLGRNCSIRLEVTRSDGESHTLALRVPSWARDVAVTVGGEPLPAERNGGYLHINRRWQLGDSVRLEYKLLTRVERDKFQQGYVSIFHGPWLLAISEEASPQFFDELRQHNRILLPGSGKSSEIELDQTAVSQSDQGIFSVPVARRKLGWIPAGYPSQTQTITLRALAEHTSTADSSQWQFRFVPQGETPAKAHLGQTSSMWSAGWAVALLAAVVVVLLLLLPAWRRRVT